jgi:hypothetical protein
MKLILGVASTRPVRPSQDLQRVCLSILDAISRSGFSQRNLVHFLKNPIPDLTCAVCANRLTSHACLDRQTSCMFSLVEFPFQDDLNILLYTVTDSLYFQMRQLGIYLTIAHL